MYLFIIRQIQFLDYLGGVMTYIVKVLEISTSKYEVWLISMVSYRVVSLAVGGKKLLRMRSVVDTVQYIRV
jgi:hypothetical protein